MKTKKLILLIAAILALLVNVPRVMFTISGEDNSPINTVISVSVEDTITRILLLFGFSYAVLWTNIIGLERIPKTKHKRWYEVAINLGLYVLIILIFEFINEFIYNIHASVIHPRVNAIAYLFFLILLKLISLAHRLVDKSKKDALEKQMLKEKSVQNELEALKNQINPHFLFNSFNTLSLLVREDPRAAGKFINKLSFLFRYSLQSQENQMVTLKEELRVVESYIHLIQHRYQENFRLQLDLDEALMTKKIPVLSLQMLLENAIKHNEISDSKPLLVEIFSEKEFIVVKNKLQERFGHIESTHKGLKNLSTRTRLMTGKEVFISRNSEHFTVKIPMT